MKRNTEVGEDLADARQKPWLIERDKLQKRLSFRVGRQEIDLGIYRKVTQLSGWRRGCGGCQVRCVMACSSPWRIAS